jgi:hypothetical protein
MRSSFFWDVTQRRLVVTDDVGQAIGTIFKDQAVKEETSANKHRTTLRNVPEV